MGLLTFNDFEGASLGDYTAVQGGSGTFAVDATSKINGTYSVKIDASANGDTSYGYDDLPSSYDEIYIQMRIHTPNGWTWGVDTTYMGCMMFNYSADGTAPLWVNLENWGNAEITVNGTNAGWRDTGESIAPNTTIQLEVGLKVDGVAGFIKVWKDNNVEGSPDYSSTGQDTETGTGDCDQAQVGNIYSNGAGFDSWYIDDVKVDTAFIGSRTDVILKDVIGGGIIPFPR